MRLVSFIILFALFSSCSHITRTDVVEEYNKFQKETVLKLENNWIKSVEHADYVDFRLTSFIKDDGKAQPVCVLSLKVEDGDREGQKGSQLWLHIDDVKDEFVCFSKDGWDRKTTTGQLIGGVLYTSTSTTAFRYYRFILKDEVLRKLAKAKSVWFELETENSLIKGHFGPKNFEAIRNLIHRMEEKTTQPLVAVQL